MKVIILGSTGILGKTLYLFLKSKKSIKLYCISRKKVNKNKKNFIINDFSNFNKLNKKISQIQPTHIVNCIGVTKFNKSYKDKMITKKINTDLPKFIANYCLKKNIKFIHVSTDCVFSGKKGNYRENSIKDSKDLYGLTKSRGEVKNKCTATIRTSFIGPEYSSNKSLLSWFLSRNSQVKGFSRAFFSGITSVELSKIIYNFFLKSNKFYNSITNIGSYRISKYDLLIQINNIFKKKIIIEKFPDFQIDRSLNSYKFQKISKYKQKNWKKMLNELKKFMIVNKYKF